MINASLFNSFFPTSRETFDFFPTSRENFDFFPTYGKEMSATFANNNHRIIHTRSHPNLATLVSVDVCTPLIPVTLDLFANGECQVELKESVRGCDIIIIGTGAASAGRSLNDNLMEICLLASACKKSDSKSITVFLAHFPYARSDKKDHRGPISAKFVIDLLELAGATRLMTMDLHSGQLQGFTSLPFDNLYALPLFCDDIKQKCKRIREQNVEKCIREQHVEKWMGDQCVLVAPDFGAYKRIREYAKILNIPFVTMEKRRNKPGSVAECSLLNDPLLIKGKILYIIDDMIDTMGTMMENIATLEKYQPKEVHIYATHGLFSDPALKRIMSLPPSCSITVTDTIPISAEIYNTHKVHVITIRSLVSDAINRLKTGGSISSLFSQ